MVSSVVPVCACPQCQSGHDHPERQLHYQINLLMSRLDEQQRRWFAALESKKAGYGGDTLFALITGGTSLVQSDQPQLGRCAVAKSGVDAGLAAGDADGGGSGRDGGVVGEDVPSRGGSR